jgi:hypothetical protein
MSEDLIEENWGDIKIEDQSGDPDLDWMMGPEEGGGGGWGEEIFREENHLSVGDMYLMRLEAGVRNKAFLCKLVALVEEDLTVHFEDEEKKVLIFEYEKTNDSEYIIDNTDNYFILDKIKVRLFDISKEDYEMEEEEIEILTEIIEDKLYSDFIKKDDLLSELIKSYDCHDKVRKIKELEETVNELMDLIKICTSDKLSNYLNEINENKIPKYLIPITDDKLKFYNYQEGDTYVTMPDGNDLEDEINSEILNNETGYTNYRDFIQNNNQYSRPTINETGVGYSTNDYEGVYLRNCIHEGSICVGINGDYLYDERKTKHKLNVPRSRKDETGEEYTIMENLFPSDRINIIGFLEEPIGKSYFTYNDNLENLSVYEKSIINNLWFLLNFQKKKKIEQIQIREHILDNESLKSDISEEIFTKHNLLKTLTSDELMELFKNQLHTKTEIIDKLLKSKKIKSKIINYEDLRKYLFKVELTYDIFQKEDRDKINKQISKNIKNYIRNYRKNVRYRLTKKITERRVPLTDERRVKLSYDYIFGLLKEEDRNILLKRFIDIFTRGSEKESENKNWLYNKYANEKILCRHYIYNCEIKNNNSIFQTMIDLFGSPPKDGSIHCRICGEELCKEEFSTFEGFDSEDKTMESREKLVSVKDSERKEEEREYLEQKEDSVNIIKIILSSLRVQLDDTVIYGILKSYEYMNNDILSEMRYEMSGINTLDIHPKINEKIKGIKGKEKKEKKSKEKVKLKKERESAMIEFQKWLKTTNKLLCYVSLLLIYIQTSVPSVQSGTQRLDIFNYETKSLDSKGLQYVVSKIKKTCVLYGSDKFWIDIYELFEDSKYKVNDIVRQMGQTILYCMSPTFPTVTKRIDMYTLFLESEKKRYIREEWVTYRPLQKNILIEDVTIFMMENEKENEKYLKKLYNGYMIENISLLQSLSESYREPLFKKCKIPEFEIIQNGSFSKLFRYIVTCYGKHENNILITLLFNDFLETIDRRSDIIKILTKYGWSEEHSGFKKLNFKELREKIIPEILGIYNKNETNYLRSCYTNEDSCNSYIHNSVNNYDLHLLNTLPKRIYYYHVPIVYPDSTFNDFDNEMIDKLFKKYKLNNLNDLTEEKIENNVEKYNLRLRLLENEEVELETFKELEKKKEHLDRILEYKRVKHLLQYTAIIIPKKIYEKEDYDILKSLSITVTRLLEWLQKYPTELLKENELLIHESIYGLIENHIKNDLYGEKDLNVKYITENFKGIYSQCIEIQETYIERISKFLVHSEDITKKQKDIFSLLFRVSESQRIDFKSEKIISLLTIFITDIELDYNYTVSYIQEIYITLQTLTKENRKNTIPKEWGLSDSIKDEYSKFLVRDDKVRCDLLLHNNIFIESDNYSGFNSYKNENDKSSYYLLGLFNYCKELFKDLEMVKGDQNSFYNETYASIYMKNHLLLIFIKMIEYIEELGDEQSDITRDANELYQLLDEREEDEIESSIKVCSMFVMDSLMHLLMGHYDPLWLFTNDNKLNILSKQKEREKHNITDKLDGVSQDERFMIGEKNKIGLSNFWRDANEKASEFVKSDEYRKGNEHDRIEMLREYQKEHMDVDAPDIAINPLLQGGIEEEDQIEDYGMDNEMDDEYYEDQIGQLDEEQEMEFNE